MIEDTEMRLLRRLATPMIGLGAGLGLPAGGSGLSVPALDLNFLSGVLDSRITFTRGSAGTFVNSSGLIESAGTNVPRFDHDPVTLAPKGLLIEEARTNLVLRSAALNTIWAVGGSTGVTGGAASPDGGTLGWTISRVSAGDFLAQSVTVTNGAVYTASAYLLKDAISSRVVGFAGSNAGSGYEFSVRSDTGTVAYQGASVTAVAVENRGLWWRVVWTWTAPSTTAVFRIWPAYGTSGPYDSGATGSCAVTFCQLEAGSFATSYISTSGAQVTRSADVANMTGTSFSGWFNRSEGTLAAEYDLLGLAAPAAAIYISDGTINNCHQILPFVGGLDGKTDVSGAHNDIILGQPSVGVAHKAAYAYKTNDFAMSADGGLPAVDLFGAGDPVVNQAHIGNVNSRMSFLNGHIQSLRYYYTRLPNGGLRSLTL